MAAAGGGATAAATGSRPPTADVLQPCSPPPRQGSLLTAPLASPPGTKATTESKSATRREQEGGEKGRAGAGGPTLGGLECVRGGRPSVERNRSARAHVALPGQTPAVLLQLVDAQNCPRCTCASRRAQSQVPAPRTARAAAARTARGPGKEPPARSAPPPLGS